MTRNTIKINGSIRRECEKCGKHRECMCFETKDKKSHVMCDACTYDEYGYGKPKRDPDSIGEYEYCNDCKGVTMKRIPSEDRVTEHHVVHNFVCACGKKKTMKIRKWKK